MVKVWRNRILAGTQSYEDCPIRYKDSVKVLLKQDVKSSMITVEKYEEITGEVYS